MTALDSLKKRIEEKTRQQASQNKPVETHSESVDIEKVEQIVQKMRRKYRAQGLEFQAVEGSLGELRGMIAEGKSKEIEVQKVEELRELNAGFVKSLAGIYLKLKTVLSPLEKIVSKLPQVEMLSYYLFSANMRYSVKQYVAISVTVAAIISAIVFVASGVLLGLSELAIGYKIFLPILLGFWLFFVTAIIMMAVPKQRAISRGSAISIELPFALRHMSTELRSGIGLYRTMQAIATSDYGVLSEEFAKTITEIEEGIETKDALTRMALRTQSKALRSALMHMVRALKTGGNISEIMNTIAEDVSFEMRMKIRDFAQKMNFFGLLFIFTAIWIPVIVTILGAVRNSALSSKISLFESLPLTPQVIGVFFLAVLPFLLLCLIVYIKASQPKV